MNLEKLTYKQKVIIVFSVLAFIFIVLNFNYFYANYEYYFQKSHKNVYGGSENPPQKVGQKSNMLYIDSLDIQAPVVYIDKIGESYFQEALINGVVHYPNTALPGQFGNVYIFGHSSDYLWTKGHYKRVFAVLPKIAKGAEIRISDSTGNEFTYLVIDSRKVSATDTSVLSQGDNKKKLLTLQTSYPVGTAIARWIVVAEIKK